MSGSTAPSETLIDPKGLSGLASLLDEETLVGIVESSLIEVEKKANQILEVGDGPDWEAASRFAHDLKSTSAQIGAERLRALAAALEADCKAPTDDAVDAILANLKILRACVEETRDAFGPDVAATLKTLGLY